MALLHNNVCAKQIIVGADEWIDFTNKDGSGVYFELLKRIYPDDQLIFQLAPFDDTINAFNDQKVDIVVGAYKDDIPNALYPNWFLDTEYPIVAIYDPKHISIKKSSDIYKLKLSWLKGYKFDRYITSKPKVKVVEKIDEGFTLLEQHNIDAFIDYEYNLTPEEQLKYKTFEIVPSRHVYMTFQHNKAGKALAKTFDEQMLILRDKGELKQLYTEDYTHSKLDDFNPKREKIIVMTNSVSLLSAAKHINLLPHSKEQSLHFIFDRMDKYEFEFKLLKDIAQIYQFKDEKNMCFSDLIRTQEREKYFTASKPISIFLGMRLYSTNRLTHENRINLSELMEKNPNFRLGTASGRSYGVQLDQKLKQINSSQIVKSPVDLKTIFRQLASDRFNLLIEYPTEIRDYWPSISNKTLYSYELADATDYVLGHLMCNNSTTGKAFIHDINELITELHHSSVFFDAQFRRISDADKNKFINYFNEVFK